MRSHPGGGSGAYGSAHGDGSATTGSATTGSATTDVATTGVATTDVATSGGETLAPGAAEGTALMTSGFELARPALLALLLLLPVYALWRWRREGRRRVPFAPLQYAAGAAAGGGGVAASRRRRWFARLVVPLETLLLAVAVVGLAGPQTVERVELLEGEGVDVVLVLDVSLSMLAEDFPPNRLAVLRDLARDFVTRSGGNRVGIVAFARDAVVQSPLTTDHRVLLQLLDGATVYLLDPGRSGGTAIGDALLVAAERLRRSRQAGRGQAVVLITDGESNLGLDPLLAARYLAADGVRLYAVGVGGEEPVEVFFEGERVGDEDAPYLAALDDRQLRALTDAAGGRFFRATDVDALEQIFAELSRLESAPLEVRPLELRYGHADLFALAVLSLFAAHLSLSLAVRRPYR